MAFRDTGFSGGSLARSEHTIQYNVDEFVHLPFRDIYHNSAWGHEDFYRQQELKNRRHAEVIVPKKIALTYLKYIVCRSQAEYETLYNLLSDSVWQRWKPGIVFSKNRQFFNNEWLHIKAVTLKAVSIAIHFNPPMQAVYNGPFKIRVDISDYDTSKMYFFERQFSNIIADLFGAQLVLDISAIKSSDYWTRLSIDGKLAYLGRYAGDEIPF